jgi:hypothetical protein
MARKSPADHAATAVRKQIEAIKAAIARKQAELKAAEATLASLEGKSQE